MAPMMMILPLISITMAAPTTQRRGYPCMVGQALQDTSLTFVYTDCITNLGDCSPFGLDEICTPSGDSCSTESATVNNVCVLLDGDLCDLQISVFG
jgi:hypothetical protein